MVDDRLGNSPFYPGEIVADYDVPQLLSEDIGLLTQPVDPAGWLANVRQRYRFVTELDETEARIARCNPGDRYLVETRIAQLPSPRS